MHALAWFSVLEHAARQVIAQARATALIVLAVRVVISCSVRLFVETGEDAYIAGRRQVFRAVCQGFGVLSSVGIGRENVVLCVAYGALVVSDSRGIIGRA